MKTLSANEITTSLKALPGWQGTPAQLQITYTFHDFPATIAFMVAAAPAIDKAEHHPEWTNVYNTLKISLRTHDADDKVTTKDVALAKMLSELAARMGAKVKS